MKSFWTDSTWPEFVLQEVTDEFGFLGEFMLQQLFVLLQTGDHLCHLLVSVMFSTK